MNIYDKLDYYFQQLINVVGNNLIIFSYYYLIYFNYFISNSNTYVTKYIVFKSARNQSLINFIWIYAKLCEFIIRIVKYYRRKNMPKSAVYLNIYDFTTINTCLKVFGLSGYHTGI